MPQIQHDSNERMTLWDAVRELQAGHLRLESRMNNLIGEDGRSGMLGALIVTVGKLDSTVSGINDTITAWKAVLADRKEREDADWHFRKLWYPIIAALLVALIGLLGTMWATRSGRASLVSTMPSQVMADNYGFSIR